MKNENIYPNFKIDSKSAVPVYEQVKRAIKIAILSDRLKDGDRLMSLRELATKLKINPNTIIKVYYQLEVEGFIYSKPGAGYFVRLAKEKINTETEQLFEQVTAEYISKSLELGYSPEKVLKEIKMRLRTKNSKEELEGGSL